MAYRDADHDLDDEDDDRQPHEALVEQDAGAAPTCSACLEARRRERGGKEVDADRTSRGGPGRPARREVARLVAAASLVTECVEQAELRDPHAKPSAAKLRARGRGASA